MPLLPVPHQFPGQEPLPLVPHQLDPQEPLPLMPSQVRQEPLPQFPGQDPQELLPLVPCRCSDLVLLLLAYLLDLLTWGQVGLHGYQWYLQLILC